MREINKKLMNAISSLIWIIFVSVALILLENRINNLQSQINTHSRQMMYLDSINCENRTLINKLVGGK